MKQNQFLFKFLIAIFVWTIAFSGLAAFGLNRAMKQDPEVLKKTASKLGWKIEPNFVGWVDDDFTEDSLRAENQHRWNFQVPEKNLSLKIINGDIEIIPDPGNELIVTASGLMEGTETDKLLNAQLEGGTLEIYQPEDLEVAHLAVKIQVPVKYRGKISIKSVSGDIRMKDLELGVLEIKTVSGDLELSDISVAQVDLKTVNGDIAIRTEKLGQFQSQTVSGDVHLKLCNALDTSFELKTVSGDIQNAFAGRGKGSSLAKIQTMSGDITIDER